MATASDVEITIQPHLTSARPLSTLTSVEDVLVWMKERLIWVYTVNGKRETRSVLEHSGGLDALEGISALKKLRGNCGPKLISLYSQGSHIFEELLVELSGALSIPHGFKGSDSEGSHDIQHFRAQFRAKLEILLGSESKVRQDFFLLYLPFLIGLHSKSIEHPQGS